MDKSLTVKKVSFEDIREQWLQLERDGEVETIFQTHAWVSTWWRYFAGSRTALILAVYAGDLLAGIAPFFVERMRLKGIPFLSIVRPMGTPHADYHTFILKKNFEKNAIVAILDGLRTETWDICWLSDVFSPSMTNSLLPEALKKCRYFTVSNNQTPCPFIALPKAYDLYHKTLSSAVVKNTRYYSSKLNKTGSVALIHAKDELTVEHDMDVFFALHEMRWNEQNQKGALEGETVKGFHKEVSKKLLPYLDLAFLTLNGKRIACQYGYNYHGGIYSYLKGMDPDYREFRIGNTLQLKLIEHAINCGLHEYDMLRGDEPYKYHLTKTQRHTKRYVFSRSAIKLLLLRLVEGSLRR